MSLWFMHETELSMLIGALKNAREVLTDKNYKVSGEMVRATLELSPQRILLGRAQAIFYKAFFFWRVRDDKEKLPGWRIGS